MEKKRAALAASGYVPDQESDLFESARIDFVHSTAKLEGSTLSAADVAEILQHDAVVPEGSMREHIEVVDINAAFDFMVGTHRRREPVTLAFVKEVHRRAAAHLAECDTPGELRWDQRYVTGSAVLPSPPRAMRATGPLARSPLRVLGLRPSFGTGTVGLAASSA